MKPRTASIIGGITGLLLGLLLFSDIAGAPVFMMFVLGFVSYEAAWALSTISDTKSIKTRNVKDEDKKKKAAKKAALEKKKNADGTN